jgi:hypothetical protein
MTKLQVIKRDNLYYNKYKYKIGYSGISNTFYWVNWLNKLRKEKQRVHIPMMSTNRKDDKTDYSHFHSPGEFVKYLIDTREIAITSKNTTVLGLFSTRKSPLGEYSTVAKSFSLDELINGVGETIAISDQRHDEIKIYRYSKLPSTAGNDYSRVFEPAVISFMTCVENGLFSSKHGTFRLEFFGFDFYTNDLSIVYEIKKMFDFNSVKCFDFSQVELTGFYADGKTEHRVLYFKNKPKFNHRIMFKHRERVNPATLNEMIHFLKNNKDHLKMIGGLDYWLTDHSSKLNALNNQGNYQGKYQYSPVTSDKFGLEFNDDQYIFMFNMMFPGLLKNYSIQLKSRSEKLETNNSI